MLRINNRRDGKSAEKKISVISEIDLIRDKKIPTSYGGDACLDRHYRKLFFGKFYSSLFIVLYHFNNIQSRWYFFKAINWEIVVTCNSLYIFLSY